MAAVMLLTVLVAVGPGTPSSAGFVPGFAGISTGVSRYAEHVAADGTWAVVSSTSTGGDGQVRVLEQVGSEWQFRQTIEREVGSLDPLAEINGLTIDGDLIAAATDNGVYVWQFTPGPDQFLGLWEDEAHSYGAVAIDSSRVWAVTLGAGNISRFVRGTGLQLSDLTTTTVLDDDSRLAVSEDNGRTLAVGIPNAAGVDPNLGKVEVFQNLAGGALPLTATVTYDNPIGSGHEFFGSDVAVDADGSIAVGHRAAGASNSGGVWIYRRDGSSLVRLPIVEPLVARTNGDFGRSLDLVDGVLLVGEPVVPGASEGAVAEYRYDAGAGTVTGGESFTGFTSAANDWFGFDVAIADDGFSIVGSPQSTGAGTTFTLLVGQPEATDKVLGSTEGTGYGTSVSISGSFAAVGQPGRPSASPENGVVEILEQAGDGSWSLRQSIPKPGFVTSTDFGSRVALDGNTLMVLSYNGSITNVTFFDRPNPSTLFSVSENLTLAFGQFFSDIDLDGDTGVAIGRGNSPAWDLRMVVIDRTGPTDWAIDENFILPSTSSIRLPTVAIDGDVIAVGISGDPDGGTTNVIGNQFGAVHTYTRVAGNWGSVPVSVLRNPATVTTNDQDFGSDVALDGTTLLVGHSNERTTGGGGVNGAAWVYEESGGLGLYGTPDLLTPSTFGDGQQFGKSVALDGDRAFIGSNGLSGRTDRAHVFELDLGSWTETKLIEQPDFGDFDDDFAADVAVAATSVLIGAPGDSNENGFEAGAVYWDTTVPAAPVDDAVLAIDVTGPGATVTAGASGIPVRDLPARAIEGYGGRQSNVASTSLDAVDGADADGEAEVLVETTVADLGLDDADGVGRQLLESILLSDVVIEGGWEPVLSGSAFEGLPLQNVTLAEVIDDGLIDGRSLEALDVSATPIGSIPIGSIALASINLDQIPLPGGQTWCDLLASIGGGYDCSSTPAANPASDSLVDLAIQGTPIGSIPIGSIPIGSIPIGSIPIGSIPIGSIDIAQAPIGSIPIGSIDIGSTPIGSIPIGSIPIGSIPIGSIDIDSVPIGSIPVGATTIGAIQLGDLNVAGIAASPIGSIPIGSIDLAASPIGSIPIGSIPIGSIPIGSIPIGSIEISGTPIGSITIDALDLAASPIGSIPIGSIPIGSIPIGSIELSSLPIGSIPIGSIAITGTAVGDIDLSTVDLTSSPIGSIPIGSIPAGDLDTVIDCDLIDCEAGFLLADAADAGAVKTGATLDVFEGIATGIRLADLIGLAGLDRAAIEAIVTGSDTVADLLTFDDLTLADLPRDAAELATTDLEDLTAALSTVSLQDLLAALGESEIDLRAELTSEGITDLNDLDADGMVLADLAELPNGDPTDETGFTTQTVADLLAHMSGIRLGDLLALHPALGEGDVDWGTATLADLSAWDDVTLAELEAFGATTVAQLVLALINGDEATFGDLLLSLVGTKRHDWKDIELGAIELENTSGAETFTSGFEITGGLGLDRTVTIRSTIPDDAVYVDGSTAVRAGDSGTLPDGAGEPTIVGNQLTWTLGGIRSAVRYEIDIDVVSALSLGTNTVTTTGAIVGLGVESAGFTSVGVQQAFEPNDAVGDSGIVDVTSGTIYASHIGDATDVDLFEIDLPAGARLSVALSDLPADYDLVVYGPNVPALAPPLRQIDPSEPADITVDPAASDGGGALLQDIPLLDLPVIGVSSNRSTESEEVVIDAVRSTGTYFVQVSGYNGESSSSPYALYIASDAPPAPLACVAQDHQQLSERGSLPSGPDLAGVNTFILVNRERLFGKYGNDATVALDALDGLVEYTNVTNTGLGTTAAIIEVDGDNDVRAAFDAYDNASCDPATANAVVGEINELVDTLDAVDPTPLEQILIVGDDDIIPLARIADDTNIANERTYASTFIDSSANSLFGALSTGHFLSDDPYGDADPIQSGNRVLYVTDIGLGRLVETPAEIAGQVATFVGFDGQLDPSTALVTGYDFLTDGTDAVADALNALPDVDTLTLINNETWTAQDVIDELFPAGDSPNIASVNAHYDHYRALPADQNAAGTESDLFTTADVDLVALQGRLAGRSLFSMGCHGGLSVPDELFPGTTDGIALDWAQAYARQGAIWVGNTGFGYGETEGVELSERLMALYAGRLDGSVNAGEALLYAKQEYLGTQQATYGAFDEKVLQQTVFYGIPFYEVAVATEPAPAPIPPRPATSPVPDTDLLVDTIEVSPDFTPTTNPDGVVYEAALPGGSPGVVGDQSTPFAPILPTVSFDVSDVVPAGDTPATVAQDAVITSLVTTDVENVDPDLARPIVDDSDVETEPRVGDVSTDPSIFVSSFGTPEGPRQSLTATLGTFRSTSLDGSGTQRLFDELGVEVYYRPTANSADQTRPTFREVRSVTSDVNGEQVLVIDAIVADDIADNVFRVFALVAVDPGDDTEWQTVEMVRVEGDRWSGSVVVGAGEIEFLVQAVDKNGNVARSTNKTEGFDGLSEQTPAGGPIEVEYSTPAGGVFTDAVTLTATAGGVPVDVQIDSQPVIAGSGTSTEVVIDPAVLGDGTHIVVFSTEAGEEQTEVLLFDSSPPVATVARPLDQASVDSDAPGQIRFTCADVATGIDSCTATLDGNAVTDGTVIASTPGTFDLVVTAVDTAGFTSQATSQFTVADTIAPVVTVPSGISVPTDAGVGTADVTFTATATDEDPATPTVSCLPASGSTFDFGTTEVTCTATDAAGNVGSASFDVTVSDDETPVIAARGDVSATSPTSAGVTVSYTSPAVTDNVDAASTATCAPASGSTFPVGNTTVTCDASDTAGNAAPSVEFTVNVTLAADTSDPVVTVPNDISVSTGQNSPTATVTFTATAVDDSPSGQTTPTPICTPASGSSFPIGTTEVTCTATDAAGNVGSASFDVTVSDDETPVIAARGDVSATSPTSAGVTVSYTSPAVTDNVDAASTATCAPASGSTFPVGNTTVTCDASDTAGNAALSVEFTVNVTLAADTSDPVVTVPNDISVSTGQNSPTATVTFTATAVDDSPSGQTTPTPICTPASGSSFPIGTTEVTCTATDAAGNVGSASFDVTVSDDEAPVFAAAPDVSAEAPSTTERTVTFDLPTATDNVDGSVVVTCDPDSGDTFDLGDTTVTCEASDTAGNSESVSFTVSLTLAADDVFPVVTVPADITRTTDPGANSTTVDFTVTATDDGPSGVASLTPDCTPASGSTFTVGVTTVTCSATDGVNTTTETFAVTVTDEEAPVIAGLLDFAVTAPSVTDRTVTYDLPTATDNVDGTVAVTCDPASGTQFELGDTEVTCTASDAALNQGSMSFTVTVTLAADEVDPVVSVPTAGVTVPADPGTSTAVVDFSGAVSATDDGPAGTFDLAPICVPASGTTFSVGQTTVTCTATDTSNNTGSASFTVTVNDTEPPAITGGADQAFEVPTTAGGPISFVEPTATDNVDGPVAVACTPASGSDFSLGTTEVTCTATDTASNQSQVTFDIQVSVEPDTELPVVSVPSDITATTDPTSATAVVAFTATATDGGPAGTVDVTPVCEPASGHAFPIGATTVTCTATDASNNVGTASFTVTVTDDEAPVFEAAPDQAFVLPTTADTAIAFAVPAAIDNSGAAPTIACDPAPGTDFALGTTPVTCTATDAAGNEGSVSFDIVATLTPDTTAPTVQVPTSAVTAATAPGETTAVVTFAVAATDDGPSGPTELDPVCVPASGTSFPVGDTTVTCTATDAAGNESSASFTVSVTATPPADTVPPVITLSFGVSIEVDNDPGQPFAIVEFDVTATDTGAASASASLVAGGQTAAATSVDVVCTPPSGSRFLIGTTTVNCTATDAAGNVGTASFDVIVSDVELPQLLMPTAEQINVRAAGAGPLDYVLPTVLDNSDDVVVTCDPPPGSVFPLGTTTVTCQATDGAGNTATIAFDIVVERQRISGDLPATGGGGIDLRPAWAVLFAGIVALLVARRRGRRLRVTHG